MKESRSITSICTPMLLVIIAGAPGCESAEEWDAAQLTAESAQGDACTDEIGRAVDTILSADDLIDVEMPDLVLDEFIDTGTAEQFVNLYGGDEVRHWTLAHFEDEKCFVYNHATANVDTMTGDRDLQTRPIRSGRNQSARVKLDECRCTTPPPE